MTLKGKLHQQENQWGINHEDTASWTSRWHLEKDIVFYPLHLQNETTEFEEGTEVKFEVIEEGDEKFSKIIKN